MVTRMFLFAAVTATAVGAGVSTVLADDWQPLFNGRDLSGWQVVGDGGDCWGVTDGQLHPTKKGNWLSTDREYANFDLELEFNISDGGNSGVFLRAPREGHTSRVGMEIQLIDEQSEKYADLKGWQRCGALYHVEPAGPGAVGKPGQWQKLRVTAEGRRVQVRLNDKLVVDADLDGYGDDVYQEHVGLKRDTGYIGLQNYGGAPIQFRNIRIRELP